MNMAPVRFPNLVPVGFRVVPLITRPSPAKSAQSSKSPLVDYHSHSRGVFVDTSLGAHCFRIVVCGTRVTGAVLFLVAAYNWYLEAESLRHPAASGNSGNEASGTPWVFVYGKNAWDLMWWAFLCEALYSAPVVFLSVVSGWATWADTRYYSQIRQLYAEADEWVDAVRYGVQFAFGCAGVWAARRASAWHNLYRCSTGLPSATSRDWEALHAVEAHFYMLSRGGNGGNGGNGGGVSDAFSNIYMHMSGDRCELFREDTSYSYGWLLWFIAVLLLARIVIIASVTFLTGTGRLGYIVPFNLQSRRDEVKENKAGVSVSSSERLVADLHANGDLPLIASCKSVVFDRYWSNILGAFRNHEHYGLLLYAIVSLVLFAQIGTTPDSQVVYVPSSTKCGLLIHPERPCTFVDLECNSIYAPVHGIESTWSSDKGYYSVSLSSHTMLFSQLSCSQLRDIPASERPDTNATGCYFYDTCCGANVDVTSDESLFNPRGEQIQVLTFYATWTLAGALLYLISSIAYAISIVWFNVAPIPQVTLNRADQPACCFEWSLYESLVRSLLNWRCI